MSKAFGDDPRKHDVLALAGVMENPTKWGLYDRDAFEHWQDGRVCLLGDAAHPMLPTMGQGASQSFEDGAALSSCFKLHGTDVFSALLHYERVRHYRATRFQFASKFLFKHLEPPDSPERKMLLKALNERDFPIFDHEQRAGDDDSWIYAFDARNVGDAPARRRSSDRGTFARAARRSTRASRSRRTCGRRPCRCKAIAESRARKSRSTLRSRIAGSSSGTRSTTSRSGRIAIRAARSSRGCTRARTRRRSSATSTASSREKHMAHFCVGELVDG